MFQTTNQNIIFMLKPQFLNFVPIVSHFPHLEDGILSGNVT